MQDEIKRLEGQDPDDIKPLDIDFPTTGDSTLNETKGHKENISFSSASQLDFDDEQLAGTVINKLHPFECITEAEKAD